MIIGARKLPVDPLPTDPARVNGRERGGHLLMPMTGGTVEVIALKVGEIALIPVGGTTVVTGPAMVLLLLVVMTLLLPEVVTTLLMRAGSTMGEGQLLDMIVAQIGGWGEHMTGVNNCEQVLVLGISDSWKQHQNCRSS